MGNRIHIHTSYTQQSGKLVNDAHRELPLGDAAEGFAPYELLLGALSYCLYSTFISIGEKMRISYDSVDLDISGSKRDEKVATLEYAHIIVTSKQVTDEASFSKAFEIATRYCSIFQTLSKVATITYEINYKTNAQSTSK